MNPAGTAGPPPRLCGICEFAKLHRCLSPGACKNGTRTASQAAHGNSGAAAYASSRAANAAHQANLQSFQAAFYNALGAGGIMSAPGLVGAGVFMQGNPLAELARIEANIPLEHVGTSFGEFIGWRIWGLSSGYLTSYSADYAWLPGHPTEGEISDHGYGGIWAFKDKHRAFKKALESVGHHLVEGWVTGSVWMYGEVVEHQVGYRSQYATVRSIEAVIPNETRRQGWRQWAEKREMRRQSQAMLNELRERYGVKDQNGAS